MSHCLYCRTEFEPVHGNKLDQFCPTCEAAGIPADWAVARDYFKEGYPWHKAKVMAGLADPYKEKDE